MRKFVLLLTCACLAQNSPPRFEVASVKPAAPGGHWSRFRGGPGSDDPGAIYATSCPLSALMMRAYGVKRFQLVFPPWMDAALFDLAAKLPENTTKEQVSLMLQDLLLQRFDLRVHHEIRPISVYELKVAKGGLKINSVTESSPSLTSEEVQKHWFPGASSIPADVLRNGVIRSFSNDDARLFVRRRSMAQIAELLYIDIPGASGSLDRPVVDKTALPGLYSFDLSWTLQSRSSAPENDLGVPMIIAIQQQLGLKLQPRKVDMDVLVVDSALRQPAEN